MEQLLPYAAILLCPLGMGLMMWMMSRGNKSQETGSPQTPASSTAQRPAATRRADRVGALRGELEALQAQQAAIAGQISRLASQDRQSPPGAARKQAGTSASPPARRRT